MPLDGGGRAVTYTWTADPERHPLVFVEVKAGGAILDAVTGVTIGWMPWGDSVTTGIDDLVGAIIYEPVDGLLIIPPGRQFGINVFSSHTTGTWNVGMQWHEKQLDLAA